ncbi:hypothetical protein [Gloeocapsa sp. PCC 73106]|uniref:hypothetical protein n=1 Tax=Gloeocapsa sp. PCC 73106 TaxID=102232 RepID=UPI0002ABAC17|nr:hypothetical protein [Gloeocapsa sp. PCC 73106]ELR97008.1 hypothetical protein GLO73106DRAFT_00008110 [Gloeocapsa sp. PCC 73106]
MTWTNVHLTNEVRTMLIKAAVLQRVSVEELASKILSEAVREKLAQSAVGEPSAQVTLPLAGLKPYSYGATPEESALPANDWEVFQ